VLDPLYYGQATRLGRRSGTTATAESTTELRSELARGTTLLALTLLAAAVLATAALTAGTTAVTTTLLTTEHATRGSVAALLLDVGLGNDLGGKVEPLAEVVETLSGEGVVVPLPRELGLEVAAGGKRLASLDDLWSEERLGEGSWQCCGCCCR